MNSGIPKEFAVGSADLGGAAGAPRRNAGALQQRIRTTRVRCPGACSSGFCPMRSSERVGERDKRSDDGELECGERGFDTNEVAHAGHAVLRRNGQDRK